MLAPVRGISLHYRIPLMVSVLLFVVTAIFIAVSYFSIRGLETAGARQRLSSLLVQAGQMLSGSVEDVAKATLEVAAAPPLKQFVSDSSSVDRREICQLLSGYAGSARFEYMMLLNTNREVLMVSSRAGTELTDYEGKLPVIADASLMTGNIYQIHDSLYYPVIAPVRVGDTVRGYVVRCRQVKVTSRMLEQFAVLAGVGIKLLVGNADGSLWTDLSKKAEYQLPLNNPGPGKIQLYPTGILGAFDRIPGTPWIVTIEVPRSFTLAASTVYLKWMSLVAALLIVMGSLAAWYLGRKLTAPLNKLSLAIQSLGSGEAIPAVDINRRDEVGVLAHSFNMMSSRLKEAHQETQQQLRNAEVLTEQLRRLTSHLSSIREEERISIARELHDHLGQFFSGFRFDLHSLKKRLQQVKDPVVQEKIQSIDSTITEGISFVRKLSSELRTGPLEDLGLVAAISWYADNFYERSQIPVRVSTTTPHLEIPLKVSTAIFRIFQESLTNISRHAQATEVKVSLDVDDHYLKMRISDNGKGFTTKKAPHAVTTLGLLGMHERAVMIQSSLNIETAPGKGCTVELKVPISEIKVLDAES